MIKEKIYSAKDLAVIVPTKDRPVKMSNLLNSLVNQSMICGRVIVIASGESIRAVVESFSERLTIEYYDAELPGQIRQRNMGIQCLDDRTKLVATLDDDIILEPDSIEKMIGFWNQCEPETVGVGFNIVNESAHQHSWVKGLMGISVNQPGKILPSGWATSLCNVSQSVQTQWLNGGATVWKQNVLQTHAHREVNSRWAICEDLIFSYPIGKNNLLYICADAKVIHDHVMDQKISENIFRFRGRSMMLWILFFVDSHAELSKPAYFFTWFVFSISTGLQGLFKSRQRWQRLNACFGEFEGGVIGLVALLKGKDLLSILEKQN